MASISIRTWNGSSWGTAATIGSSISDYPDQPQRPGGRLVQLHLCDQGDQDRDRRHYKVTGNITIYNPASVSQSFSVTDELYEPAGTMANVDCNSDLFGDQASAIVPAGFTYVCTYTASTGSATLNTATARSATRPT